MPEISIVIPVYNEYDNLDMLIDEEGRAMASDGENSARSFELILVDDGSTDDSAVRISELEFSIPWLRGLCLIRNYGQSTALQAGFDIAQGEIIVTLDGDLQNDPSDIPKIVDLLMSLPNVDCISGWRVQRQDATFSRKLPSRLANVVISWVTGVKLNDYGCALKVYRSEVIRNLRLYGELHRFVPALAVEVGARIVEVAVNHRSRRAGQSKYGIDRALRVLLDLLWIRFTMNFLHRPIHAFGGIATFMLFSGLFILTWLGFEKIVMGADVGGRPLLILGALLTLVGVQLLATGLVGELLVRIYHEPKGRRQYIARSANDVAVRRKVRPESLTIEQ